MSEAKQLREQVDDMWTRARRQHQTLRDIYAYIMPFRETAEWAGGEGAPRTDLIFDNTAVELGYTFAGRVLNDFTPAFRPFFSLEAGPLIPEGDGKKQFTEELQKVGQIVSGVLSNGSFPLHAHEMYYDLFAGNGNMLMMPGDDVDLVRFRTVPELEVAKDEGPYGDIWHIDWKRKWKAKELKILWPKGDFAQSTKQLINDKPNEKLEISQYTAYDETAKRWKLKVLLCSDKDNDILWQEEFRAAPWLTPRFFKVPGETAGRGAAHLALAGVKTLNKARELALMAAALAVMGIFTRRNDGVFNPDTARFEPLAFWQVASNGGPLGPTVQRLDVPKNFDVSSIVMTDERQQVQRACFGDTLPPDDQAVRSATEIAGRLQRDAMRYGGVSGRLTTDIVVRVVQRTIDILEQRGALKTNIKIDQLLTQVRVVSPMAQAQNADKVKAAVDWQQMLIMLYGREFAMMIAETEGLAGDMGRWMGVEEKRIRSAPQREQIAKLMAQMAAAEAQANAPPPTPATPEQVMNGGVM